MAGRAGLPVPKAEVILPAPLAVGAIRVILAVGTVATVARGTVEFRVKVALLRSAIAVTGQAFAGALGSRPPPRPVVEERKTLFTVYTVSVVFAVTHQLVKFVLHALACMSITFTPTTHSKIGDCIVIGFENFGVIKHFISKSVQAIKSYSDVSGSYPLLQHRAIVKVVGAGPSFQGRKGHVAPGERRNVTEFIRAQGLLLVPSCPDEAAVCLRVGVLAGAAVVLVRDPGPVFPCALVNGEALWAAGVELEAHIRDVKSFSQVQREVDGVGVLHAGQHGLALPPGGVGLVVVVGQEGCPVLQVGLPGVAQVTGLGDPGHPGLHTVLLRRSPARVGGHHGHVEGGVDELGHAALRPPALVRALVHGCPGAAGRGGRQHNQHWPEAAPWPQRRRGPRAAAHPAARAQGHSKGKGALLQPGGVPRRPLRWLSLGAQAPDSPDGRWRGLAPKRRAGGCP